MKDRALQILLDYDVIEPKETSKEDFKYAKEAGYMFDNIKQTHDETIDIAFQELEKCDKKQITNLFLSSLSTHNLNWRIGLPTFAIMQTFPKHKFTRYKNKDFSQTHCEICGSVNTETVDFNFINQIRFSEGGIIGDEIYDFAFLLLQHNKLPNVKPNSEDFRIFNEMMNLIVQSPDEEKPNSLQKKLKTVKGFKSNEEERRRLLETLGFCSILETEQHKGFLSNFTNLGLAPRNGRSSDWKYPVDWWKGKDGINIKAFNFWFSDYNELKIDACV
jgi:hypothetical protein